MGPLAAAILADLAVVERERAARAQDAAFGTRVHELKTYQQARFRKTYADLLESARYGAASRFFLDELYGPADFSRRDAQFARVVPALVRLFSEEVIATVATLAALHALSEVLDSRLARVLPAPPAALDARAYAAAWRGAGTPAERERQIALTLEVGVDLDRLTRKPLLRHSLRLMRGPAQAAGLDALQRFLESGFDTFRAMGDHARTFLDEIGTRERALAAALFAPGEQDEGLLGQLP